MNPCASPKFNQHEPFPGTNSQRRWTHVADDADGLVAPSVRDPVIVLRAIHVTNVPQGRVQQAALKLAQAGDVRPPGAVEPANAEKEHVRGVFDFGLFPCLIAAGAPHAQAPQARVIVPRRVHQLVAEAYIAHQFVFVYNAPQVREDFGATGVDFGPFRLPNVDVFKFCVVGGDEDLVRGRAGRTLFSKVYWYWDRRESVTECSRTKGWNALGNARHVRVYHNPRPENVTHG